MSKVSISEITNCDDKRITAEEAKNLMKTSNCTLRRIYKAIKECAINNEHTLKWEISETMSHDVYTKIVHTLEDDGFEVTASYRRSSITQIPDTQDGIKISWK